MSKRSGWKLAEIGVALVLTLGSLGMTVTSALAFGQSTPAIATTMIVDTVHRAGKLAGLCDGCGRLRASGKYDRHHRRGWSAQRRTRLECGIDTDGQLLHRGLPFE